MSEKWLNMDCAKVNSVRRRTVAASLKQVGDKLGYRLHRSSVAIATLQRLHNAFTH